MFLSFLMKAMINDLIIFSFLTVIGALNMMTDDISTMQKLKDHLVDQRKDQKPRISVQDHRIFAEITENNWDTNTNNDRLEMLGAAYQDVCSTINRINASSPMAGITCDRPKILSDMITFKKNLKYAFELTKDTISSEKRYVKYIYILSYSNYHLNVRQLFHNYF